MIKVYSTKQTKCSFPKWYHDAFWTHMILLRINDELYKLIPPNQLDWHIKLKYKDSCWYVSASKDSGEYFKQIYKVI
jgi:hypothetical protein